MKHTKTRRWVWAVVAVVAAAAILIGLYFVFRYFHRQNLLSETLVPPEGTKVILHYSAVSRSSVLSADPRTEFVYYDADGKILGRATRAGEHIGDLMLPIDDKLCYIFQNETVLADSQGEIQIPSPSRDDRVVRMFMPDNRGYIPDLDLIYGSIDVGKPTMDDPYLTVLRFVSGQESYEVNIPFYVSDLSYNAERREFYCFIWEIGWLNDKYVKVIYDEELGQFRYEGIVHQMNFGGSTTGFGQQLAYTEGTPASFSGATVLDSMSKFMAKGDKIYLCYCPWEGAPAESTHATMHLAVFDIDSGNLLSDQIIRDRYPVDERNKWPVIGGSPDTPFVERNGVIYVFSYSDRLFRITDEEHIEEIQMPFSVFEDARSMRQVPPTSPAEKFERVAIQVTTDGDVLLAAGYDHGIVRIFRLEDDGTYTQLWEGKTASDLGHDLEFESFLILDES